MNKSMNAVSSNFVEGQTLLYKIDQGSHRTPQTSSNVKGFCGTIVWESVGILKLSRTPKICVRSSPGKSCQLLTTLDH